MLDGIIPRELREYAWVFGNISLLGSGADPKLSVFSAISGIFPDPLLLRILK